MAETSCSQRSTRRCARCRCPASTKAILSDTVGFISDLPTQLVAAFRATLEEVLEADVLVHVRDISHPGTEAQARDVLKVLQDLGVSDDALERMIEVHNKIDLLDPAARAEAARDGEGAIGLSAATGENCAALLALIEDRLFPRRLMLDLSLPHASGAAIAWLYRHSDVRERTDGPDHVRLSVEMTEKEFFQFRKAHGPEIRVVRRETLAAQ